MELSDQLKRLEKLEQDTIIQYFESIPFSNHKQDNLVCLHDFMIVHLLRGNLNDSFLSDNFVDLEEDEKRNLLELVQNYSYLIFYQGNSSCWMDSLEGVTLEDMDLVCLRIIDNYDFLLKIARKGGESVLKQLSQFQKSVMSKDGSVLEYLRNTFCDDKSLIKFLIGISKTDGLYAGLSDDEKIEMCIYLRKELNELLKNNEKYSYMDIENELLKIFSMNENHFCDTENELFKSQDFVSMFLDINYNY